MGLLHTRIVPNKYSLDEVYPVSVYVHKDVMDCMLWDGFANQASFINEILVATTCKSSSCNIRFFLFAMNDPSVDI
jgi:hypothetical protein